MDVSMRTYWLSMHLPYRCRHSGVCCSSGWDIPIEQSRVAAVTRLRGNVAWLTPVADAPPEVAGVVARGADGRCVFRGEQCEIHHAYGHDALPAACQHFPRIVVLRPDGACVVLSHYCPTAADLLFTHEGPVEIVEGPAALPGGEPEGLDARDVLPPLLVPGVLMDWDGYRAWEAHMVRVLTEQAATPDAALDRLEADWRVLERWRPGGEPLSAAFKKRARGLVTNRESMVRPSPDDAILGRYLAARAFASWAPFSAPGAAAVVADLRRTLTLVRAQRARLSLKEAIRAADLAILHRAEPANS
jgi:hypothetical protein